ncbi:tyrosine-type recombinase/integrase [bacterium]|nr:tyrosine-type recombinase/integrase [bacterium]MBU1918880.1 tyrosine-type recombinase/integrase [bacterium]
MFLDLIFTAPHTLKKYKSGPLAELLEGFCSWLLNSNFSYHTIRSHLAFVFHFGTYLEKQSNQIRKVISSQEVDEFLKKYSSYCKSRGPREGHLKRMRFALNRFVSYLRSTNCYKQAHNLKIFDELLNKYLTWMKEYQNISQGTLDLRSYSIKLFFEWLGPLATVKKISTLTQKSVEEFCLSYAKKSGQAARRTMHAALRTFFRFCLHREYIQNTLDQAVPTLHTYKLSRIPRGFSNEHAKKILKSIKRNSIVGKRDYAICQLLYTYGVRGGQVRKLKLEDINWEENKIRFKALKHGKDSMLPLTVEVGNSLLDYLQNARPNTTHEKVFLTVKAPYKALTRSTAISEIVSRRVKHIGINVPSRGTHAFRHAFATRMLQEEHSLKEIADVLGHRHLSTTFIYAKVDFKSLKTVGLEWPQEVTNEID